jgi:hypothetical protein
MAAFPISNRRTREEIQRLPRHQEVQHESNDVGRPLRLCTAPRYPSYHQYHEAKNTRKDELAQSCDGSRTLQRLSSDQFPILLGCSSHPGILTRLMWRFDLSLLLPPTENESPSPAYQRAQAGFCTPWNPIPRRSTSRPKHHLSWALASGTPRDAHQAPSQPASVKSPGPPGSASFARQWNPRAVPRSSASHRATSEPDACTPDARCRSSLIFSPFPLWPSLYSRPAGDRRGGLSYGLQIGW